MPIAHDMSPTGRLTALLERCEMHAGMGNLRHMPDLLALVEQTRRIVSAATFEQMEARTIEPQRQPVHYGETPA